MEYMHCISTCTAATACLTGRQAVKFERSHRKLAPSEQAVFPVSYPVMLLVSSYPPIPLTSHALHHAGEPTTCELHLPNLSYRMGKLDEHVQPACQLGYVGENSVWLGGTHACQLLFCGFGKEGAVCILTRFPCRSLL